ncbi:MAG: peptide deformylase [Acidobacteria bacterium]|nr:peptide deformylase [Acidobacteriota bacterium]
MAARRILQLGDPVLRMVSSPVSDPAAAAAILADLEDTLAEFRRTHGFGRGISAIQIGETCRVIFLEVDGTRYQLINPEFTWQSEERFDLWDDCFSFPNLMVRLSRHRAVRIRHQDLGGAWHEFEARDALSELVQHEMDHLDGILAVDHAAGKDALATREEYLRRLAQAQL